jgi:ribosome-associated protein
VETSAPWWAAVRAMQDKKGDDVKVLDLRPVTSFADFMLICSGTNPRQIQAIAGEVERLLEQEGERARSVEGYKNAEWILMDYGDYVVNVFSNTARAYYELERLWRDAPEVSVNA